MGSTLNNQAIANYEYPSGTSTAVSNVTVTNINSEFSLIGTKYSLEDAFRPGSSVTFIIRIENNGSGTIYNPQFTDKLEGVYYRIPTLKLFINSVQVPVTPYATIPWLTVVTSTPLYSGDVALFTFVVDVPEDYDPELTTLRNCVNVGGNKGAPDGPPYVIDDASCIVLPLDNFAQLTLSKQASSSTVSVGDTLVYTIMLSNSGNESVTHANIVDTLPTGFNVTAVSVTTGGITTDYGPTDYHLDIPTNTITIPSLSGPVITVPPAVLGVPGTTVCTITGIIT